MLTRANACHLEFSTKTPEVDLFGPRARLVFQQELHWPVGFVEERVTIVSGGSSLVK